MAYPLTMRLAGPLLIASLVVPVLSLPAAAQTGANVAVVINESSTASIRVGEHYVARRGVPASNVVRIKAPAAESISRIDYVRSVEEPIGAAIARHGLQDQVLYIVLTKGIPLRIDGTDGPNGTAASVDSELTLLYRRLTGRITAPGGSVANPYYLAESALAGAQRFTHRLHDIFLVTRIDAFSVEEAIGLIDRGMAAASDGVVVLDQRAEPTSIIGDRWMAEAAQRIRTLEPTGRVVLEETRQRATVTQPVLGYYSWGSTDPEFQGRTPTTHFAPGAIAAMLTSTDARTFEPPPAHWKPSNTAIDSANVFAGSSQSLIGDLIQAGVTGVSGNVAEPLLQAAVRPQILFPAYFAGFNLAESFYLALPQLSWQTVVIGDPLSRPFPGADLPEGDGSPATDAASSLPASFMERRLGTLQAAMRGLTRDAAVQVLASEARRARGDRPGAREALARAIALAPEVMPLRLDLALLHEQDKELSSAIALYRDVLTRQPRNPIALNNLAYALSTSDGSLAEALVLARKAYALSPSDPTILDTVGWVEYLNGNKQEGVKILLEAAEKAPENADIRLHSAVALAGIGSRSEAVAHLAAAVKLDPTLLTRADVIQLQKQISGK